MGVHKVCDPINGDNHLSPFEIRLWDLTYSCLYKYGCPVIFNVYGPNVPHKLDQHITFFVSRANPMCAETVAYLHEELDDEVMASSEEHGEWRYGKKVSILEFEGTHHYSTVSEIQDMTHRIMGDFMARINSKKNLN